jgi:hypothetical protein
LLYQELIENLIQERELLIDTDMDSLWSISDRKQIIASRIETVRAKILDTFSEVSRENHGEQSAFSLPHIMSMIPHEHRGKFRQAYLTLVQLKSETRQRSFENKTLVEQRLDFLDELISIIAGDKKTDRVYDNGGAINQNGPSNMLLSREV